ncbi:hypothetical protein H4R22_002125 [Coemansia sp. RSA 1290]|nr:hypothetical protein H4R22_002125 [Coemansia sp. RSA 1290]
MSQSEKIAHSKLAVNRRDDHARQAPSPEPQTNSLAQWRLVLYENRTLASAITAAVTGMLVGYPFDSLKTRMQTHHYSSLLECARKSITDEGIYGLYRGLLPPLLTASAAKSLSFSVFEQMKQWLRQHDPYKQANSLFGLPNFQRTTIGSVALTAAVSGWASGAVIAALCCPLELIKVQMQLASLVNKNTDSLVAASKTTTGQAATIGVRDASGTAIYFSSYETVKETLRRLTGSDKTGVMTHMFSGGICGVLSWLLIFPVDLVKSTMQSQVLQPKNKQAFTSAWHCLRDIYGRRGLSGLYRGVSVSLIRAFPIHGLNFVVYEWARATICRVAARPE